MVGYNLGTISQCYATGSVTGSDDIGGLVGENWYDISKCFWDIETSGIGQSGDDIYGAVGKTTAEMQTQSTFTDAGWDFVGETSNGTNDL